MGYDASNRKHVRSAEKEARLADAIRKDILSGLMSQPLGRAYIFDQLEAAHIFHTSFNTDPLRMAFTEGERNGGLRLLNDLLAFCPNQFTLMLQERNAEDGRRTADDSRYSRGDENGDGRDSGSAGSEDADGYDIYSDPGLENQPAN